MTYTQPITLHIEPGIRRDGTDWVVDTHARRPGHRYPQPEAIRFPTESAAREWVDSMIRAGAMWVRLDFRPGALIPRELPDIQAWRTPEGLTVQIDGQTVASGVQDSREFKRAVLDHPRGHELALRECSRCGRKPRLNLAESILRHVEDDCPIHVVIDHPAVSTALKIAAWNIHFSERFREVDLAPVTLPQLEEIGVIRPPTMAEIVKRIQRIEIL